MRKATGVIQFFKKYCIEVLLTISALLICFVHAIPAGLNADFWPINGDFQNYNVVRRFLDGQTIYKDFVAYLGYGHLLFGSILTFIFGKGNPTLMSSKMAFQFAALFAFSLWVYAIFRAIFYKKSRLVPLVAVNIFLLILVVDPDAFRNTLSVSNEFYNGMQYALSTGNSARFLREVAPVLFVAMSSLLYRIKKKIPVIDQSENLSLGFVFGIPAGIIFYYSNDYGVTSTISIFMIVVIAVLFEGSKSIAKIKKILIFIVTMAVAFSTFGIVISHGHFSNYLATTFGTGGGSSVVLQQ